MNRIFSLLLVLDAPGLWAQETPAEIPAGISQALQDQVLSRSAQFRVTGGDAASRGAAAILAEETKQELLTLTAEPDQWKVPISVLLHGQRGDPMPPRTVSMQLLLSEAGYDLRMNLHLSRGIEKERFQYATTSALLCERALRNAAEHSADTAYSVPPWLVVGLREASAWQQKQSDRRLYEALFKRGGLYKLDELFALTETQYDHLDAAMRTTFRVSSGALVMALLEQPEGKDGFRSFLSEVAAFDGEMPVLLRKHFPGLLLSETSLAKWWALQLANKGTAPLSDIFSIAETETSLAQALTLHLRTEATGYQTKPLAAWAELGALTPAERREAVRPAQDGLIHLSYRCFPSYRPLIAEYQLILTSLDRNETSDVPRRLQELETLRSTMISKAQRAADYLDWFEITRARETSGAFDDYLRLKERLKARRHPRKDPLSLYLDRMDQIFDRDDDSPPHATGP